MVEDGLRMVSDEFHFARVLRARVAVGKQVMSWTCVLGHSALSEYSIL